MKHIRWGIIGCGDVTEVKSGPGFQKAQGSKLKAVMRRNGRLAADYAARHQVETWYDDADRLIHDCSVDAVYVATPPAFHREYALKIAEAGKPAYIEKPLGVNYPETLEIVEAFKSRGIPLYSAYYRRAHPKFLAVQKLIASGALGEIRAVRISFFRPADISNDSPLPWRVQPEIAGGGYFMDLGSHALDLMDFLFGPIVRAAGHSANQGGRYPAEDIVAGSWCSASGVHGTGLWCFSSDAKQDEVLVIGSRGSALFSLFAFEPVTVRTEGGRTETIASEVPDHAQQPLIQTVVDDLITKDGCCPSTGESALRTAWVLDVLLGRLDACPPR